MSQQNSNAPKWLIMPKLLAVLSFWLLTSFTFTSSAFADTYTALDLGSLGGTGGTYATGINAIGQVVGSAWTAGFGANDAFITGANGAGMTDLSSLGGSNSIAHGLSVGLGINASGQVVGYFDTAGGTEHAFVTGANGAGMIDLGTLGGTNNSYAKGINASGRVVGDAYTIGTINHAFITGANGVGVTELGTLGGAQSYASGINASGQVAGFSYTGGNAGQHAFITGANGVGMTDLGTLGGVDSYGSGINASGQVVGSSYIGGNAWQHAFITGANGAGMTDLGTLGGAQSYASGINASGQVAGESYTAGDARLDAFITGANGAGMVDLNSLVSLPGGVVLTEALGVNDVGQIIADGNNGHAYLLTLPSVTAVPEPDTYVMLITGFGLVGVAIARRRTVGSAA